MNEKQMQRMMLIKNKIESFDKGSLSKSKHYWCVTCKKFFVLDKPECPYMTGMCVNTPIAVENLAPENTESLEKFGLFYPKLPQKILNYITENTDFEKLGEKFAKVYIDFLKEWNFKNFLSQPLQTLKSFIILLTGSETAQRVNEEAITFVIMDVEKVWEKDKITAILQSSINFLKDFLKIKQNVNLEHIQIFGEREIGKYYCAKCGMFFEFGIKRDKVTCPLMSQKCMFDPQNIEKVNYPLEKFLKQFVITPDIYKRLIKIVNSQIDFSEFLNTQLKEWNLADNEKELAKLLS